MPTEEEVKLALSLGEFWQRLLAGFSTVGAFAVTFLLGRSVQSIMCPSDSILTGWVGTGWMLLGGDFAIVLSVLGLFIALAVARDAERRTGIKIKSWRKLCGPGVLFILSVGVWLDGVSSHFCASESTVTIHDAFIASETAYSWQHVAAARPNCWQTAPRRRGLVWNDQLILIMRDGTQVELGFANEKLHGASSTAIRKIFARIPIEATWNPTCDYEFRNLFAKGT
jgi:hypothetical protein